MRPWPSTPRTLSVAGLNNSWARASSPRPANTASSPSPRARGDGESPRLGVSEERAPKRAKAPALGGVDQALFEALRKLRRAKADDLDVPAFVIFSDAALRAMAQRKPTTQEAFLGVSGVGQKKAREYGSEFTRLIADYVGESGDDGDQSGDTAPRPTRPKPPANDRGAARKSAFELFEQGYAVDDVSQAVGRAVATVEGYLLEFVEKYKVADPNRWISAVVVDRVRDAIAHCGSARLKTIREHLGDDISYSDLRICLACLKQRGEGDE